LGFVEKFFLLCSLFKLTFLLAFLGYFADFIAFEVDFDLLRVAETSLEDLGAFFWAEGPLLLVRAGLLLVCFDKTSTNDLATFCQNK
jgi:hypothetical protein